MNALTQTMTLDQENEHVLSIHHHRRNSITTVFPDKLVSIQSRMKHAYEHIGSEGGGVAGCEGW